MGAFFRNQRTIKAMAMLLVIATICGLLPPIAVPILSAEQEKPYVTMNDERISHVVLEDGAKLRFEAGYANTVSGYQWQIRDPENESWVDIADGHTKHLWVTYALVGSMLEEDNTAQLRCRLDTDAGEAFSDPVKVTVSLKVEEFPPYYNSPVNSTPAKLRAARSNNQEFTTYSIVINYLFDDNTIAFEPYGATVAAGSPFKPEKPIESPKIMGYKPFRRDGNAYVEADSIYFNIDSVNSNITINVIYKPTLVDFKVHHHLQNVLDDDYATDHKTTERQGLTGSLVGPGLAYTEDQLPGFKPLDYDETLVVAADGSTVVEIRYDRNYYLISFDMGGGYGTEPIYTRFGATVGANTPTRHGYIFDGWELVSYGGQTPTNEQKSQYALNTGGTIEVPAASLKYKARWITKETTYTMVFWCENANDNGYTYWGYLDNLPAMSGSYVSAQDYISRVAGIDDEQHFTFNASKSDKNVLVEGDGSTVVNAYYTRNYYSITFKASGTCILPTSHTHSEACYDIICGLGHTHTAECVSELTCTTEEHTAHTDECIICGKQEHIHGSTGCSCDKEEHTHSTDCWNYVGNRQGSLSGAPSDPEEGEIYATTSWWFTSYYIYIGGDWYSYTGRNVSSGDTVRPVCGKTAHIHGTDCSCAQEPHRHQDSCYRDILHTHGDYCYKYSCGTVEHTHTDTCKRLICGIPTTHSHSNEGTNGKVVKIVYAKYRQSLKDIWPVKDDNGVVYSDGQRWSPSGTSLYDQVLVYIDEMPGDSFTLTVNTSTNSLYTMNYYLQVLPGEAYDVTYKGKNYALYTQIKAKYGMVTKAEDFFPIRGFDQYIADPDFGSGTQIKPSDRIADFYYDRIVDHKISFSNNGIVMDDETVTGVMYGASVKDYNFDPPYPTNLEPNAYTFDGWYTSPGCFDGTQMDWENTTMPEGDLLLYAKWKPITHTVRVYKDKSMTQQLGAEQIVDHGDFAKAPAGDITNGNYVFLGWFYEDEVGGEKVEKAFVFEGIPVLEDMNIYARWGSHFSVDYKIYYKLRKTGEEIAAPTIGSAIVGNNKTFYAKTESDLYEGFRVGYFPETSSHTITMSAEGNHEFTFYYEYVEAMPYKVRYLDENGNEVFPDKRVMDNGLSVVTETFVRASKMMPDAYQKRLVLSADKTDSDGDGIYDANVIIFHYSADEEHAYYRVVHYIENITGDSYREFSAEDNVGVIGEDCTGNALTFTGFAYNPDKTTVNGVAQPGSGTSVTTRLTEDGALIEFYYDRLDYQYQVRYIDSRTNEDLYDPYVGTAAFGEQVIEYARNFETIGYKLVSENFKVITISANQAMNVIDFYYEETTVGLKYQIVGPDDCGSLTMESENLPAISGQPNGSQPLVKSGFVFLGWYKDAACTEPVDPTWVDAQQKLTPQMTGTVWTATTYYAKFAALETDLILTTKSTAAIDGDQVFIFRIQGEAGTETEAVDLTVTVVGDDSVTITKLPTGSYTVTELTDWSWRYENSAAKRKVNLTYNNGSNEIIYDNSRENGKWLDGNTLIDNQF